MATNLENLKTRYNAVTEQIASLSSANYDLPNAGGGSAVTADFTGKIKSLYEELAMLKDLIIAEEGGADFVSEVDC